MRVLLINPPYFAGYQKLTLDLPPLGLAYIASLLRQSGHEVQIADMTLGLQETTSRFDDFDLVGISSDTPRHNLAMQLAKKVKQYNIPVIMGGPHVSFLPEESLQTGFVDYVIKGEGEYILKNLVDHLNEGGDVKEVPGISYINNGEIVHNTNQHGFIDVNDLPLPSRDLLKMDSYNALLGNINGTSIIGSRGCPFNCSFCASSQLFGLKWRPREPEDIVDEIMEVKKRYGIKGFFFMDDNHTLQPDRTIRICELINNKDLDISWWCFSRVNTIVEREDMVQAMAASGCQMVFIGVESPNQDVLDSYNKNITPDLSLQAIKILHKHNIKAMASFIIGELNETEKMIQQTIAFSKKIHPEVAQFSILTPYPGTRLFQSVKDLVVTKDWRLYDGLHAVIKTSNFEPKDLENLLKKAYFTFYTQFARLLTHPISEFRLLKQVPQLFKRQDYSLLD
ncbi:MAG TPA: radical SAM protein [Desulfohalobiaceae bacterium]|nr:radical SAM protein [Desulfohalobiaceae bacterium]